MRTIHFVKSLSAAAALLLAACVSHSAPAPLTPAMTGSWQGEARIIVSWTSQKKLPVALKVQPDGSVTGTIGDAKLVDGRLGRNRGSVGRKLNFGTDYIIRGSLDGPVIRAEGIEREGVSVLLNFTAGSFSGGLHTSGTKIGGKDKMVLSATALKLEQK